MFKNETHNHPTEIEPLRRRVTCIGGAIRSTLVVLMFIKQCGFLGAGDITQLIAGTRAGKPQQIISKNSSGMAIFLTVIKLVWQQSYVLYSHPGFVAKLDGAWSGCRAVPKVLVKNQ